jgi:hypothetical protein
VQSYPASSPTASRGTAVAVAVGQQYVPVTMVDHQAGLAKNPGLKKKPAQWFFLVFLCICPEERVFRVFQFQEYF